MPSDDEIHAAAKAMILLSKTSRSANGELSSRLDEAKAALEAAEAVRSEQFRPALSVLE